MIHDTQATVKLMSKLYELIGDVNARFIIDIGYCHFYRVSAAGNKFGRVRPSVSALTFEPSDLRLFTARCYASAVLAMGLCPSVSVFVCLSQAGVLLKRQDVGSHKQHHTIPRDSSFLMPKISAKFDRGHPLRGRRMQVWWVNIGDF